MSTLKDALCLLAIFFAYGITGHMDYEDAVMLEETKQTPRRSASTDCWRAINARTGSPAAQVHHAGAYPLSNDLLAPTSGPPPEATELCTPVIF